MIETVLQAIAEPRRREILTLIQSREMSSGEIASHFDVTRPAISQHLRVLEDAGLVSVRKHATSRFYRARPEGLSELRAFLEEFWSSGLQRLKQVVESAEHNKGEGDKSGDDDSSE